MCDPITVLSVGSTILGTALQMKSQADARSEQKAILRRNSEAQDKLMQKNSAELVKAREGFNRENFDSAMSNETADLTQKYQAAQSDGGIPGEFSYGKTEAPQIVKDFEMQKRGQAKAFTNDYAAKLADMAGFSQAMFDKQTGTRRAGEVFDMNRSFMAGNNAVTQQKLAAAQANAGSPLGDILSTAGLLGMAYGLRGPGMATDITAPGNAGIKAPTATLKAGSKNVIPAGIQIPGMPSFGGLY